MVVNDLATSAAHRLLKENKDGWIPLHDAAFCGQTECIKILLKGMVLKAFLLAPNMCQSLVTRATDVGKKNRSVYSGVLFKGHFPQR